MNIKTKYYNQFKFKYLYFYYNLYYDFISISIFKIEDYIKACLYQYYNIMDR